MGMFTADFTKKNIVANPIYVNGNIGFNTIIIVLQFVNSFKFNWCWGGDGVLTIIS